VALVRAGLLGLGHIGGSIALAVGDAVGWDPSEEVRSAAAAAGVTIDEGLEGADIVVVAAPLAIAHDVVADAVERFGDHGPTITDVASVKGPVLAAAAGHPAFVSGHPMAGTELSGFEAADPELFRGAPWLVLVPDGADLGRVAAVCRLALAVGADPVPIHPAHHDRSLATVSHLPHVLAAALTLQAESLLPMAAGSLHGAARVAAGDPALPTSMVELNRDEVVAAIEHLQRTLDRFRDDADPARWFVSARTVWDRFRHRDLTTVERPLTVAALRAVGDIGGHVVAIADDSFTAVVPA
jgi:prephenate dehydrogenase